MRRLVRGRLHALARERVQQRNEKERVATRSRLQGVGEDSVGLGCRGARGQALLPTPRPSWPGRIATRAGIREELRHERGCWPARAAACRQAAAAAARRAGGRDTRASAATARRPSAGRRRRAAPASARRSWRRASRGRAASRTRTPRRLRDAVVGADAKSDALSPAAPREQLGAHVRRRRSERRLEQLPDDPERELALELAAARSQHLELAPPRRASAPRPAAASCRSRRCPRRRPGGPRRRARRRGAPRAWRAPSHARASGVERRSVAGEW